MLEVRGEVHDGGQSLSYGKGTAKESPENGR